jgi:Ca-activated chloride channel family protein
MIEWEIRAQAQPSKARAPLNLSLILNHSGLMSGDKLNYVKQATRHVLDLLEAQDRVAIIAYNDRVTMISSSVLVTAAAPQQLKTQIDALQTGGATDLSGEHFYFIEKPTQIPQVFQQELGELLTVVAREALLSLSIPSGVSLEVLGDLPHERDGERMRIYHGKICAG